MPGAANEKREKKEGSKIHRRAAKVERVACAYGHTVRIAGFHLCMYSTNTLHPSPITS